MFKVNSDCQTAHKESFYLSNRGNNTTGFSDDDDEMRQDIQKDFMFKTKFFINCHQTSGDDNELFSRLAKEL